MRGTGLTTRYVTAVLLMGLLVTAAVAATVVLGERHEMQHVADAFDSIERIGMSGNAVSLDELRGRFAGLEEHVLRSHVLQIIGVGILLSLLGAGVTLLLIRRIDRAMVRLMSIAERIEFANRYRPWEGGQPLTYGRYFGEPQAAQ